MDAEGLRRGDAGAIRDGITLVVQWCLRRGLSRADADDVALTTVQRAYDRIAPFREESRLETWLIGIACNVLNEQERHRTRRAPAADRIDHGVDVADADADVERLVMDRMAVEEALSRLTEEQRDTVVLLAQGLTSKEAAAELGCSPEAVRSRHFRAAQKIGDYAREWYGCES